MNILVTAGNTRVFVDRVRCITNIFTGRTGAMIALEGYRRGHRVTLLTSHSDTVAELKDDTRLAADRWRQLNYQTLEDLRRLMEQQLQDEEYESVVHSAAVSDYLAGGIFAPAPGTVFIEGENTWRADPQQTPALVDHAAPKVKSGASELWLRLVRAPKLIDMVRGDWGFGGSLVKFKLEVGVDDEQLLRIAEKSRVHSRADLMVANTLEGASSWAYIGPFAAGYAKIARADLAGKLLDALETRHPTTGKHHG